MTAEGATGKSDVKKCKLLRFFDISQQLKIFKIFEYLTFLYLIFLHFLYLICLYWNPHQIQSKFSQGAFILSVCIHFNYVLINLTDYNNELFH